MRYFAALSCLAILLALAQATRMPSWAGALGKQSKQIQIAFRDTNNVLAPRFDTFYSQSGIVARAPKGGGKGGGHSSSSDSSDDSSSGGSSSSGSSGSGSCSTSSSTNNCLSTEKPCLDACIPSSAVCCDKGDLPAYCGSSQRCVLSSLVDKYYKCCPASDSTCNAESSRATYTNIGNYRFSSSGNSACNSAGSASEASRWNSQNIVVGGVVMLLTIYFRH